MCLLTVLHRVHADAPLLVAANRDELLARPATAMAVLRERDPRILGGRDHVAGGTWLAVNEHGVVAGLTNLPSPRRDPSRRSRGELPLALAAHREARAAAAAFVRTFRQADYNPAWLLVGDRASLHYIDLTGAGEASAVELPPGIHVLENRALGIASPKVDHVASVAVRLAELHGEALRGALRALLAEHALPWGAEEDARALDPPRPLATYAPCVHAGPYGTRSASIVLVPEAGPPRIWASDGPPCTAPLVEATGMWRV